MNLIKYTTLGETLTNLKYLPSIKMKPITKIKPILFTFYNKYFTKKTNEMRQNNVNKEHLELYQFYRNVIRSNNIFISPSRRRNKHGNM